MGDLLQVTISAFAAVLCLIVAALGLYNGDYMLLVLVPIAAVIYSLSR